MKVIRVQSRHKDPQFLLEGLRRALEAGHDIVRLVGLEFAMVPLVDAVLLLGPDCPLQLLAVRTDYLQVASKATGLPTKRACLEVTLQRTAPPP